MAVVLFDTPSRSRLYPFTYTKCVADLRIGYFTLQERWQKWLHTAVYVETEDYLQCLYDKVEEGVHTWINACVIPSVTLVDTITRMQQGDVIEDSNGIIACRGKGSRFALALEHSAMNYTTLSDVLWLTFAHEMLSLNHQLMVADFNLLTAGRQSSPFSDTNQCINAGHIFLEEGAWVECCCINAANGPVYIGKNATVMEGSLLRGPIMIGENSVVKMGTKLYGATSIGPDCTVGGEIKNVVMQGCSNKGHDGYLGDSLIGEWCNMGAGTSNSNLKNTAGDILLWSHYDKAFVNAGNKFGVMMGDYTRVAINTSINTGSVYGVGCNVFGESLLPTRLRNFAWGVSGEGYKIDKALNHIRQWKNFKQQSLSVEEEKVLTYIFDKLYITDETF